MLVLQGFQYIIPLKEKRSIFNKSCVYRGTADKSDRRRQREANWILTCLGKYWGRGGAEYVQFQLLLFSMVHLSSVCYRAKSVSRCSRLKDHETRLGREKQQHFHTQAVAASALNPLCSLKKPHSRDTRYRNQCTTMKAHSKTQHLELHRLEILNAVRKHSE